MGVFHQLKGMLKSHFILMQRNKCLSFIELFCPIILLLFYFFLRLLFSIEEQKYESLYSNDVEYLYKFSTNLTNKITSKDQISFEEIDENSPLPYTYFLAQCKINKHIAIIGKDFPEKLLNKISSHFWELDNVDKNDFFKYFDTVEDFDNYITSKNYGTDEVLYPKICFGISKIDKFKFGIHYNTINVDNENTNEIENLLLKESPHIPESKSNKNDKIKIHENLKFFDFYKTSGYLMVMKLISDYILEEITESPNAEINYSVIGMIYDYILKDSFHKFLSLLGFFLIISYSIIFSINLYREIHFRETKKKEYLKSMGMKERVFFLSSFIRSFLINLIHSLLGALIIYKVLNHSQYKYLFVILFLFGLVIFSMTYFFQSFLQGSRKGVILGLLCFCIMSFLYLPINSPEIKKSIVYLFCILFPPTNLLLGFNVFFIFEKEFISFNDNINIDVSQITILQMILFLVCSFFIYLFCGFIINQCFCSNYKKCCCSKKKPRYNMNIVDSNSKDFIINKQKGKDNDPNNLSNFGQEYIFDDESNGKQQHKPENEALKKSIKVMSADIMNTPSSTEAYKKKVEKLTNSLKELDMDLKGSVIPKLEDNEAIYDELEMDFDNVKIKNEIRNKRREIKSSMSNLKSNEYFVNNNLKVSEIKKIVPNSESFLSQSLQDALTDGSILNETILEENEYNKIKDENNPGARLEIINLKKYFKKENYVINDLSCTLYENEIFALLGENGAGKSTLISILSGMLEVSDGIIKYKVYPGDAGADITTSKGITHFRKTLGVCPQNNNILFDQLTVKENLEIFCLFKYDKKKNKEKSVNEYIENEVNDLLNDFELDKQKDKLAKELSGGQKRKLCIAIACCGRSKVIILDEPTGGVDISSRKNIWNILKKIKYQGKIILLITHFMDEASFLADKIGILRHGKLVLNGTNSDLIENYGQYITLKINKGMEIGKAKEIVKFIKSKYFFSKNIKNKKEKNIINENENNINNDNKDIAIISMGNDNKFSDKKIRLETFKKRVIIRIPRKYFIFSKSYLLLEELEKKFQIKSYTLIKDQLEDVFINAIHATSITDNAKDYLLLSNVGQYTEKYNCINKFKNEIKISFLKRIKDYKTIIIEILFPIILILIACLVSYVEWLEDNKSNLIELSDYDDDLQTIFYEFSNISEFQEYYPLLISKSSNEKDKLKNIKFKYLKNLGSKENYTLLENLVSYMVTIDKFSKNQSIENNTASFYLITADKENHQYEFASIISTKKRHSPIAFTNYLLNNIIKYEIDKKPEYKNYLDNIGIINSPFHLTYEEKNNKKGRHGLVLTFFISIALSLIPSNFIIPIMREKENKSKHLQILSGISIFTYWLNNYIFEIIKYIFIGIASLLTLKLFNFYEKYLIVLFILYSPALISFTYCLYYFINSEGSGQTIVLLINLIFGALGGTATLIIRTNKDLKNIAKIISYIFRFVPSFCICYGYNELLSKKLLFAIDNYNDDIIDNLESLKEKYNNPELVIDYIKIEFIYLSLEIIIYTTLFMILEQKDYLIWRFGYKNKILKKYNLDEDEEEYDIEPEGDDIGNVEDVKDKQLKGQTSNKPITKKKQDKKVKIFPLEVYNLKKYFNKFNIFNIFKCCKKNNMPTIDDLSFKVGNGECFGFIGANGSGKTTTFRCLCKEIKPDDGLIKIDQIDINDFSPRKKVSIGYCPQFDSIFEHLTVEENLNFYGKLKGIRNEYLKEINEIIMKKLDLLKFKYYKCKELSGGNKRKLSVGISIMSQPNVIFMDEPSTGMDPYTRRLLLDLLHKAYLKNLNNESKEEYKQKAIILTTHSIEEVESLCDKIGILIKGRMEKNNKGTINKVVQNHSKGLELNIEFKKPSKNDIIYRYKVNSLSENINNINELKKFLRDIKKEKYFDLVKADSLGRDILQYLKEKKQISKGSILIWVKYLECLFGLVNEIKKYFDYVDCINFKLNNFILNINNFDPKNKCDSYLFGIIERYKDIYSVEEYSYSLTTLESVFLNLCQNNNNSGNLNKDDKTYIKVRL